MTDREMARYQETIQDGWDLYSYSKVRITFAVGDDGSMTPIRQEIISGPRAGTFEECTDCMGPQHHNGQASLDLSVTAYQQSSYPSHWNFHGHFHWLDTVDAVNLNDDYVSMAWAGNQALDWHGLHLFWEDGTNTQNDFYLKKMFPNQGLVLGFEESKAWGVFGAYKAAEEGFMSVLVHQNIYQGLAGNVSFNYHHTWQSVTSNFSISLGIWPSITFGSGSGKWEETTYTSFTY